MFRDPYVPAPRVYKRTTSLPCLVHGFAHVDCGLSYRLATRYPLPDALDTPMAGTTYEPIDCEGGLGAVLQRNTLATPPTARSVKPALSI
jgi:hypothetical protein